MANTIKLKTGSGSDPSASDLIVGEIAIRTDSGKLFTKKDNGSVAEISGGGGIDDGDKGDITISNGGDTFTIDNGVVTSAKIANGTIVDADISGSAAIAGSKLQAAGLVNAGSMSAANFNKLAGIEANATADMTGSEILSTISGENIILGEISSTGNSSFAGNLTVSSSDGGSSAAPELDLYRISASPADADYLGQIKFSGESDDGSKEIYAKITGKIGDASSGTEDGILEIAHRKAGSNNISARFTSTDLKLINGTGLEVAGASTFSSSITSSGSLILNQVTPEIQLNAINHENDFRVINYQGNYIVQDVDALANRFVIQSDGTTDIQRNLNCGAGIDVTGNISVTGTVDGVDIATRDTLFGGLTSSSGVLSNGVTATTQSAGNNTTRVATTAFVSTAISNLINNAPSALDTLKELSDALGADANFSTTVTNNLATKMPLAGGQFTGNITFSGSQTVDGRDLSVDGAKLDTIESNATADQTASEILSLLVTVDGSGSGLDADTLDGIGSSAFVRSDTSDNLVGDTYTFSGTSDNEKIVLQGTSNPYIRFKEGTSNKAFIQWHSDGYLRLQNQEAAATVRIKDDLDFTTDGSTFNSIFHEGNLTVGDGGLTQNNFTNALKSKLDGIAAGATNVTNNNQLTNGAGYVTANTQLTNEQVQDIVGNMVNSNTESGISVTYADNGGSAGKLNFSVTSQTDNNFTNADHSKLDGIEAGATADMSASEILTLIKTVDGAGSGLDADTLDGISSASFVRSDADDTMTGNLTISNAAPQIFLTDTNANDDFAIVVNGGSLRLRDETNGVNRFVIDSNGNISAGGTITSTFSGNLTGNVTGNTSGSSGSCTGNSATATALANARTIAGVSFDGSANISLNNNAITNGAGYITSADGGNAATLDSLDSTQFLRSDANDTMTGTLTIGDGSGQHELHLKKADNNTSDHLQFYNGTTRTGEIGSQDNTWLRINQVTNKNIYTPRYIRADNGFFVDGTSKGINGSGNFIGGTIAGASDYGTLLRSDTADTASGVITFSAGLIGNVTGNASGSSGSCTGNAATATKLATARTIAGVSFDGSANISLNNNAITNGAGYLTSVTTSDIANDAVTVAKIQNFGQNQIAGRISSGTGNLQGLSAANVRTIINVENGATADQTASEIVALIADQTIAPSTIDMEDNEKIRLGTGDDLLIYHDGSDSYLQDSGTGKLVLSTNGARIDLYDSANNAALARFITGGSVELYEAGNKKLETSTSGVTVTGTCTATAFAGDGSALTGISAGATGGGSDQCFYENDQTVTTNYTITNGKNAMAAGPLTINSGVTVTVGSGETLTIV